MSTGNLRTYFRLKIYNLNDHFFFFKNFYRSKLFWIQLLLFILYLPFNPYRISKKFLMKKKKKRIHAYGETPISALNKIVQVCKIGENDHLLELGFGRGRALFFLSEVCKCKITGIEWIGFYYYVAKIIVYVFNLKNVQLIHDDIFKSSFEECTFIYLYGTSLTEKEISKLKEKIIKLKKVKVITISYPLSDGFKIIDQFDLSFPWGKAQCYINEL